MNFNLKIPLLLLPTPLRNISNSLASWVFGFAMYEITTVAGVVSYSVAGGGIIGDAFGGPEGIKAAMGDSMELMKSLGFAFVGLFFLMALIDLVTTEQFTLETFIKAFSKFAAGFALVYFADKLVNAMADFSSAFATYVNNGTPEKPTSAETYIGNMKNIFTPLLENDGGFWIILIVLALLVGAPMIIFSLAIVMVANFICITREIELAIRGMLMPLALSLWTEDGFRGGAGRYLKKYFALLAQGGVLVLIAKLASDAFKTLSDGLVQSLNNAVALTENATKDENSDIKFDFMTNVLESFLGIAAVGVGVISIMWKSIGIINDAFGV